MFKQLTRCEDIVKSLREGLVIMRGRVLDAEAFEQFAEEVSYSLRCRKKAILASFGWLVGRTMDDRLLLKLAYGLGWYDKDLTAGRSAVLVSSPDQVDTTVVRVLSYRTTHDGLVATVIGAAGPLVGTPFSLWIPKARCRWFQRAIGYGPFGKYSMRPGDSYSGLYVAIAGASPGQHGWVANFDVNQQVVRRNRLIIKTRRSGCDKGTLGLFCRNCTQTMRECHNALRWSSSCKPARAEDVAGNPESASAGDVQPRRVDEVGGGADSARQQPATPMPAYPGG